MRHALVALLLMLCVARVHAVAEPPGEGALGGTLTSVGSDTLGNLMTRWAEAFQQQHPGVAVQVQTPGSSSAPIALTEGAASFGAMSREMNAAELTRFQVRYGYAPTAVVVARDAVVVFVHPDNPLRTLAMGDLAALFGASGACGGTRPVERWSDLGGAAATPFGAQRVLRIGRNGVSGTSAYFSEATLCGAAYRDDIVQLPGSGAVVAAVAAQRNAIGYAGIGYVNALVRALALQSDTQAPAVAADAENIRNGRYPLSRPLYLYLNLKPDGAPPVLLASFFRFILSPSGQDIASREGFLALTATQRDAQMTTLRIAP